MNNVRFTAKSRHPRRENGGAALGNKGKAEINNLISNIVSEYEKITGKEIDDTTYKKIYNLNFKF